MTLPALHVQAFAEYVPDEGAPVDHPNPRAYEPGAGFIELGFYIGGKRVVLQTIRAGAFPELFHDDDPTTGKLKSSAAASSPTSEPEPDERDQTIAELQARIAELEQAQAAETTEPPPAE